MEGRDLRKWIRYQLSTFEGFRKPWSWVWVQAFVASSPSNSLLLFKVPFSFQCPWILFLSWELFMTGFEPFYQLSSDAHCWIHSSFLSYLPMTGDLWWILEPSVYPSMTKTIPIYICNGEAIHRTVTDFGLRLIVLIGFRRSMDKVQTDRITEFSFRILINSGIQWFFPILLIVCSKARSIQGN